MLALRPRLAFPFCTHPFFVAAVSSPLPHRRTLFATYRLAMDVPDSNSTASGPLADKIKKDHRELTWEIARHAIGEELVVYPLMEKHLGVEGKKLADQDRADHQARVPFFHPDTIFFGHSDTLCAGPQFVKERLNKLESLTPGEADYDSLLGTVMEHLNEHNNSEEQHDLMLLEPALGAGASESAAASFQRTKQFVPTRAHPSVPDQPPMETLAGLLAAPMDKLKDAFSKFPTDDMMKKVKN
ncbi:hypothetical protein DFH11DRAFT_1743209 [Phellopilus nigrolimitatus]|nr:hypothetical protein DFH11DRAFT_1743209 [Phellopilus nigrolimitatus]